MNTKRTSKSLAPVRPIETLIHVIKNQKVMLDFDLAALYGVQTGALNQAVKRNLGRFPEDFMFPLTAGESETLNNLKSQTVISSQHGGRRRSEPNAFTQEGIAMLSSVLRSPRAIEMNIMIMRAFVRMRELIAANKDLAERVEKLERGQKQTVNIIEVLVEDIDRLGVEVTQMKAPRVSKKNPIGFPVARAATP